MDAKVIFDILFLACSITAVVLSILVVILKNPIYSSLSLVASFLPIAVIYLLLHASFVSIIQILVYAGAIMVLFTFVIMMIDLRKEEYQFEKSRMYKFLSLIVVGIFLVMMPVLVSKVLPKTIYQPDEKIIAKRFSSPKEAEEFGSAKKIGELIFGKSDKNVQVSMMNSLNSLQIISFELSSILIMVAILGAMVLGFRRRSEK